MTKTLSLISVAVILLTFNGVAKGATTTPAGGLPAAVASKTADAVFDFVSAELGEKKDELGSFFWDKVKGVLKGMSSFVYEKIGVNLYEGGKLFIEFIVWFFESLARFARWLLGLF